MRALGLFGAAAAIVSYAGSSNADMLGLPYAGAIALGALFGPSLIVAVYAFQQRLENSGSKHAAALGFQFVSLGAALLCAMVFMQVAMRASDGPAAEYLDQLQRTLDICWDVFLAVGTFCFAMAVARLSRLAFAIAVVGAIVSVAFFSANLIAFPRFPTEIGWPDLGPAMLGWYVLAAFGLNASARSQQALS